MTAFDSLAFKRELTEVDFPSEQAEALAGLMRDQVLGNAATKDDLAHLEQRIKAELSTLDTKIARVEERLKAEIRQLGQSMTIKLGSIVIVGVGVILAALGLM
jgi:hypothetical protein